MNSSLHYMSVRPFVSFKMNMQKKVPTKFTPENIKNVPVTPILGFRIRKGAIIVVKQLKVQSDKAPRLTPASPHISLT